jgi:hypothetical protein
VLREGQLVVYDYITRKATPALQEKENTNGN